MEFEKFSKEASLQIEKELKLILKDWRKEVGKIDKTLLSLVDQFVLSCSGGKRIRGILVVLGYEIGKQVTGYSGSPKEKITGKEIFKVAAAYEIFHSAILAHDDVIDQSSKRRGKPSLYTALGGGHYGISQAISLGDAGFFLAIKIISESEFPAKEKNQAQSWFIQIILDTTLGEILDVEKGNVRSIMKLKTAEYSVSGPLVLGAILGGRGFMALGAIKEFGEYLGIAFQIQDDILGVFGSEEIIGKSVTSDITEGKNTLLYNYALKQATVRQQVVLQRFYGNGSPGEGGGMEKIRQVFEQTGALEYARKEADRYKEQAMIRLREITKNPKLSKSLQHLAEYLVKRIK